MTSLLQVLHNDGSDLTEAEAREFVEAAGCTARLQKRVHVRLEIVDVPPGVQDPAFDRITEASNRFGVSVKWVTDR